MNNRKSKIENRKSPASGFTLIETALATVIVGVGVLAIVSAQQAYHQQNGYSQRMGQALMLANEIREMTLNLPRYDPISGHYAGWGPEGNETAPGDQSVVFLFDDLDDFDGDDSNGVTISPPVDAIRREIPGLEQWSQHVTVEHVPVDQIDFEHSDSSTWDATTSNTVMRVTCRVLYQGPNDDTPGEVTRLHWVRTGR